MKIAPLIVASVSILVVGLQLKSAKAQPSIDCLPGEIYEGSRCSSFTKCVGSKLFKYKIEFDCPPGTYFSKLRGVCDHDFGHRCPTSGPKPPSPFIIWGPQEETSPPGGLLPGPPGGALTPALQYPPIPAEVECPQYEVDPSGVYDCPGIGSYPSFGDCHTFYHCINSMGCIVKGFYISCPPDYLFDSQWKNCTLENVVGPCEKIQDPSSVHKISPVIALTKDNYKEFFRIKEYWKFMKFIPRERQRIIYPDLKPSELARNTRKKGSPTRIQW